MGFPAQARITPPARRLFPDAPSDHYFFDVLSVHPYTDGRSPDETSPDETSPDTVVQGTYGPIDKSFGGLALMKAVLDRTRPAARTSRC
jgi:hypothetical protein